MGMGTYFYLILRIYCVNEENSMLTDFPVWQQLRIFSPNPRHFAMGTFGLVQRVIRACQLCSYLGVVVHTYCILIQIQSYWLSRVLLSSTTLRIMIEEALCHWTCSCIESISTMTTSSACYSSALHKCKSCFAQCDACASNKFNCYVLALTLVCVTKRRGSMPAFL